MRSFDRAKARALLVVCGAAFALLGAAEHAPVRPQTFASPDAAVEALATAAASPDEHALLAIFGTAGHDLIVSGDAVADENAREAFTQAFAQGHHLETEGDARITLVYGDDDSPFPIPLVKQKDAWHFDADAGREELLARRVGRNELAAIQVCLAVVDAQREYASEDRDGDGLLEYAPTILSTPGKHDGLYWETKPGEPESPLGELIAHAQSKGYEHKGQPYYGYLFRMLKAQGPHASGGAYDYEVRGKMIGGFGLVAYPVEYGVSGVMTFVVNHDGVVFSKNLGPNTAKLAAALTRFDPDSSWKKEE